MMHMMHVGFNHACRHVLLIEIRRVSFCCCAGICARTMQTCHTSTPHFTQFMWVVSDLQNMQECYVRGELLLSTSYGYKYIRVKMVINAHEDADSAAAVKLADLLRASASTFTCSFFSSGTAYLYYSMIVMSS
jgi:hypothetical protein